MGKVLLASFMLQRSSLGHAQRECQLDRERNSGEEAKRSFLENIAHMIRNEDHVVCRTKQLFTPEDPPSMSRLHPHGVPQLGICLVAMVQKLLVIEAENNWGRALEPAPGVNAVVNGRNRHQMDCRVSQHHMHQSGDGRKCW